MIYNNLQKHLRDHYSNYFNLVNELNGNLSLGKMIYLLLAYSFIPGVSLIEIFFCKLNIVKTLFSSLQIVYIYYSLVRQSVADPLGVGEVMGSMVGPNLT